MRERLRDEGRECERRREPNTAWAGSVGRRRAQLASAAGKSAPSTTLNARTLFSMRSRFSLAYDCGDFEVQGRGNAGETGARGEKKGAAQAALERRGVGRESASKGAARQVKRLESLRIDWLLYPRGLAARSGKSVKKFVAVLGGCHSERGSGRQI